MKRILIVEDEKPLRDAFEFLLSHEGYKVASAENGQSALQKLNDFSPDLIVLDMLMPLMNGLEFLQACKPREKYPKLKTLMLSNLSDSISPEDARKYGVSQTLVKADLSPTQLVQVVQGVLAT